MGAPKGNQYYKLRSKDGKDKQFKTPEDLLNACNDYFQWCLENPIQEEVVFHSQGVITKGTTGKMRAFTMHGLCNFIDLSIEGFRNYENRKDYLEVTKRVRQIVYAQKFEGAAAGMLNANIIARDLGLSENVKNQNTNVEITPEEVSKIREQSKNDY